MATGSRGILLDTVKGVALTVVLCIAYLQLPVVGMLAGLVAPLPTLYYSLKWGRWVTGILIVAASVLVLAAIGGPGVGILYLMQSGLLSVALAHFLLRGAGAGPAVAAAVMITATVIFVAASAYSIAKGIDLQSQLSGTIGENLEQTLALYRKSGATAEELETLGQLFRETAELLVQIFPAVIIVGLGAMAAGNIILLGRFQPRLAVRLPDTTLRGFRNPDYLVWGVIAAGFALLVDNGFLKTAALNVMVVAGFLYFIQGMAVISHFFRVYAVPSFFRIVFYVLLLLQAYLALAVALLGLFDLWGDFRRPRIHRNL